MRKKFTRENERNECWKKSLRNKMHFTINIIFYMMFLPISCSILIVALVLFLLSLFWPLSDSKFGIYHWIVIVFFARLSVALYAHYGVVTIPLSFSIQSENAIFVRIAISLPRCWWFLFRCVCSLLFFILTMAINKWNVSHCFSCLSIPKTHIIIFTFIPNEFISSILLGFQSLSYSPLVTIFTCRRIRKGHEYQINCGMFIIYFIPFSFHSFVHSYTWCASISSHRIKSSFDFPFFHIDQKFHKKIFQSSSSSSHFFHSLIFCCLCCCTFFHFVLFIILPETKLWYRKNFHLHRNRDFKKNYIAIRLCFCVVIDGKFRPVFLFAASKFQIWK